jgi:hypothetical protein
MSFQMNLRLKRGWQDVLLEDDDVFDVVEEENECLGTNLQQS